MTTMVSPRTLVSLADWDSNAENPFHHSVQKTGVLTLEADHFPERWSSQITAGRSEAHSTFMCLNFQESQCCSSGRHVGAAHEGGVPPDAGVIAAGVALPPCRQCLRMRTRSLPTASDTILPAESSSAAPTNAVFVVRSRLLPEQGR